MRTPASYNLHFNFNFESTKDSNVFCRTYSTVSSSYSAVITVLEPLQDAEYVFLVNNTNTTPLLSSNDFSNTSILSLVSGTDSVYSITVSCYGKDNDWDFKRTYTKTISVGFFDYLPTADFLCWPESTYIPGSAVPIVLNRDNYYKSRGVRFYGEGSTNTITLSSKYEQGYEYIWNIGETYVTGTSTTSGAVIAEIDYPSVSGVSESVPISLKIIKSNSFLNNNTPNYFKDDITGETKRHSYFISTSSADVTPNRFRENLNILTYDPLDIRIDSTFPNIIFGSEGKEYYYDVYLKAALSGSELKKCYGLYGDDWKWSSFEEGLPTDDIPSTWSHMSSAGLFPKKWKYQPTGNVKIIPRAPVQHKINNIKWEIYSSFWKNIVSGTSIPESNVVTLSHLTIPVIIDGLTDNAYHFSYRNDDTFVVNISVDYQSSLFGTNNTVENRVATSSIQQQVYIVPDITLFVNNKYTLINK